MIQQIMVLIAEGFDHPVPKGHVYFAMAFSIGVEMLNIRVRRRPGKSVDLRKAYVAEDSPKDRPNQGWVFWKI